MAGRTQTYTMTVWPKSGGSFDVTVEADSHEEAKAAIMQDATSIGPAYYDGPRNEPQQAVHEAAQRASEEQDEVAGYWTNTTYNRYGATTITRPFTRRTQRAVLNGIGAVMAIFAGGAVLLALLLAVVAPKPQKLAPQQWQPTQGNPLDQVQHGGTVATPIPQPAQRPPVTLK
jgi:hypothetical protein